MSDKMRDSSSESLLESPSAGENVQIDTPGLSWFSYVALPALFVALSVGDLVLGAGFLSSCCPCS